MTIKGLEPLLEMRKNGKLPGRTVLLWIESEPFKWSRYSDFLSIPEGSVSAKDDFRVLTRLHVVLAANSYTSEAAKIMENIKQVAESVIFVGFTFHTFIVWDRENGEREI